MLFLKEHTAKITCLYLAYYTGKWLLPLNSDVAKTTLTKTTKDRFETRSQEKTKKKQAATVHLMLALITMQSNTIILKGQKRGTKPKGLKDKTRLISDKSCLDWLEYKTLLK